MDSSEKTPETGDSVRHYLVALVALSSLFNASMFPLTVGNLLFALLSLPLGIAVPIAQFCALTCWLVWSEGPFLRRLALHWAVFAALGACLVAGIVAMHRLDSRDSAEFKQTAVIAACVVPAFSLAAQLPLWILRIVLGWRLVPQTGQPTSQSARQLTILDILLGTFVVGVSLGLARATPILIEPATQKLLLIGGGFLAVFCTSLLVLVPAVLFLLRSRRPLIGLLSFTFYLFAYGVLGLFLMARFALSPVHPVWFALGIIGLLFVVVPFAATLSAPLLILRYCGYRLVVPRADGGWSNPR